MLIKHDLTKDTALPKHNPTGIRHSAGPTPARPSARPRKVAPALTVGSAIVTLQTWVSLVLFAPVFLTPQTSMAGSPERSQGTPPPFFDDHPPEIYPQLTLRQAPVLPADESLWPLVRSSLVLDHQIDNPRVQQELRWLRKHPDFVQRLAPRMRRYAPFIFRELERRAMPGELLFLAMIESALDPFAFSPGGAAGLWQFMPATGERFGLKVDWWSDERRDPVLATNAALDYLQLLHRRFDSWELAIAAYNAGEGRISRAVRKAGTKEFSKLRIPRETAGYLPRLLAFAEVFNHPETYGLTLPKVSARVSARIVETGSQLDLSRAASALGVSVQDLYDWNPALNQWATHPRGPHRLLVGQTGNDPQLLIDQIPMDERLSWTRHSIREGETLGELAERYHTDTKMLMQANNLKSHVIRAGTPLLIPTGKSSATGALPARRRGVGKKSYRVVRGDSLWEIAKKFDVSLNKLMRLNHIGPKQHLRVGARLIIPAPAEGVVKEINYRVRAGDSLSRIAQRFNVTTREIMGWNELDLAKYLQPGQRLRLYVDLTAAN